MAPSLSPFHLLAVVLVAAPLAGCVAPPEEGTHGGGLARGIRGVNAFGDFLGPWNASRVAGAFAEQGLNVTSANEEGVWTEAQKSPDRTTYVRAERRAAERWQLVYVVTFDEMRPVMSNATADAAWSEVEPAFLRTLGETENATGWRAQGTSWFPLVHRL